MLQLYRICKYAVYCRAFKKCLLITSFTSCPDDLLWLHSICLTAFIDCMSNEERVMRVWWSSLWTCPRVEMLWFKNKYSCSDNWKDLQRLRACIIIIILLSLTFTPHVQLTLTRYHCYHYPQCSHWSTNLAIYTVLQTNGPCLI